MLGDRYFYPLAALLVAVMIALALSLGGGEELSDQQIVEQGWQMEGQNLQNLTVSPGSASEYVDDNGGYVRLSQFTPDGQGPASIGVIATLPPDYERAFAGETLRIKAVARRGSQDGLETLEIAYYPMETPPSGWKTFTLSETWEAYDFTFTPPIADAPQNVDLIAIFPGRSGEQKVLELRSLSVEVIQPS